MTPTKLRKTLEELLGKKYTLKHAAFALRCDEHALDDWLAGKSKIPAPVISVLELVAASPPDKRQAVWSLRWLIDDQVKQPHATPKKKKR